MNRAEAAQRHAAAGFPSVGDPGFCFPAKCWNGSEFNLQRWACEGKACKPPR